MYAVEYTCINEPMPVMTRIITADSGSRRSVKPASNSPDEIHENTCWTMNRASSGSPTSRMTATTDTTNDAAIAPTAIAPDTGFDKRRPKLALSRKPTSGRSGISSSIRSRSTAEIAKTAESLGLSASFVTSMIPSVFHHFSAVNESGFSDS